MNYHNMIQGTFLARPNRFIAHVEIQGETHIAHVKNTGRFKELLIPGVSVYLQDHKTQPHRKTRYSLIAVEKGDRLINLDSQVTNRVAEEALRNGCLTLPGFNEPLVRIQPETSFQSSRLDFFLEGKTQRAFLEVKAVTLEEDGIARFPDAPTERGIKHLEELTAALEMGYMAYTLFVIQMDGVRLFQPNDKTHQAFGDALRKAVRKGVIPLAYTCSVTKSSIRLKEPVPIDLN